MWTYLNGEFIPKKDVRISPFDRGFLFGDSGYEVIPSYDNQLFLFNEHLSKINWFGVFIAGVSIVLLSIA